MSARVAIDWKFQVAIPVNVSKKAIVVARPLWLLC